MVFLVVCYFLTAFTNIDYFENVREIFVVISIEKSFIFQEEDIFDS